MIKKIYLIMVAMGSILLSSRDSYLDIQPVGQAISTTLTGYCALLTIAYELELISKSVAEFRTDIAMVTDNSSSQSSYSEIEKWNDTSSKDGARELGWVVYYSVIYYASATIANKDDIKEDSQENIDQPVREAYLLRGYMYFILANLYGQPYTKERVPKTKPIPVKWDLDLEVVLPRNTIKEVYTAILSDIESARGLIHQKEWGVVYAYHFSTLPVDAMESRMYLYMGSWKEAYDAVERILVQESILEDLNDPRARLPNNYTSAEMIIAYEPFNDDVTSVPILIPVFMKRYDVNKDLRRNKYYSLSRGKHIPKRSGKAERNCTFRAREVYLNAAEAAAQMNELFEIHTRLLQLMKRWYTPEGYAEKEKAVDAMNQADLIKEILEERALELAFEDHRWFNLCHTTRPRIEEVLNGQAYLLERGDPRYTLRIPQNTIAASPGLLD